MRRPSRTTLVMGAAIALAAAGGAALSSDSVALDERQRRSGGDAPVHGEALPDDDAGEQAALEELATVERARAEAAALESAGSGTVVESELEEEDGLVVWEVDLRLADGSGREVEIDAGDGRVLESEAEEADEALPDDDAGEQAALEELATVERARAEAAALESAGSGTVVESELEEEDGLVVWEVDLRLADGSGREVEIDAGDGRVLESDPWS